jgi:hypothetical protein
VHFYQQHLSKNRTESTPVRVQLPPEQDFLIDEIWQNQQQNRQKLMKIFSFSPSKFSKWFRQIQQIHS